VLIARKASQDRASDLFCDDLLWRFCGHFHAMLKLGNNFSKALRRMVRALDRKLHSGRAGGRSPQDE
jgi:hypothetical protein